MTNITKIQAHPNQRNSVTLRTAVPSAIASAIRLKKGDAVEWLFDKGDVVVRKV